MKAIEREIEIVNEQGLHARPVMQIVDLANKFIAIIRISKGDLTADATSAMSMMLLEAPKGTKLRLSAVGDDAGDAIEAIVRLVADRFHED